MAAMAAKKRPCRYCLKWFSPDAKVGGRQRTCSRPECQAEGEMVTPSRVPRPLDRLPWDLAQDQFKVQGAEFLLGMGRVLRRHAQDQRTIQPPDSADGSQRLPPPDAQDQIRDRPSSPR